MATDAKLARGVAKSAEAELHATAKAIVTTGKMTDELIANGGNVTAAAKVVGVSAQYARKLMPKIREELIDAFAEVDATVKTAAHVVADAMKAKKVFEGVETDVSDHGMRLKGVGVFLDVTGARAPNRSITGHQNLPSGDEEEIANAPGRLARIKELEEMAIDVTPSSKSSH